MRIIPVASGHSFATLVFLAIVFTASCFGAFIYHKVLVAPVLERVYFVWWALLPCTIVGCLVFPEILSKHTTKIGWTLMGFASLYLAVALYYQDRIPTLKGPNTSVPSPAVSEGIPTR